MGAFGRFSNKYSLKIGPRSHKFQHPNNKFEKKGSYFLKILIQKILNSKDII